MWLSDPVLSCMACAWLSMAECSARLSRACRSRMLLSLSSSRRSPSALSLAPLDCRASALLGRVGGRGGGSQSLVVVGEVEVVEGVAAAAGAASLSPLLPSPRPPTSAEVGELASLMS